MVQNTLKVRYFTAGYCTANARIADPINGKGNAKFYAVWALIEHPHLDLMLFDTGYASHFQVTTEYFPARLYRWLTPVFLEDTETASAKLRSLGILPENIKYVIISHFHADHVAGLRDFPTAQFICSQKAYQQVKNVGNWQGIGKGIIKALLPQDFEERCLLIENIAEKREDASGLTFFKLFGQNDFDLVALPGHARGMLGFYAQGHLFATDASWDSDTFLNGILPSRIAKLFFDSWTEFVDTQNCLRRFASQNPEVKILFTHCPKTLEFVNE